MAAVHRRRRVALGVAIAVVASVVAVFLVLLTPSHSPSSCIPGPPQSLSHDQRFVVTTCDSTVALKPHSFTSYTMVRFSDQMTALGQYSATTPVNISFGAFLLNSTEFSELLANPSPTHLPTDYFWSSGPGPVCNLSVEIPGSPAQYYLVIENAGSTEVSIEWTLSLVIYYGSTPAA
ncbi:MAG TPA: hypothetical protein VMH38_00660 [Thermoplasmata archaeon]|nr:hypothetical protein [Thermoplasmata archaeon]